MKNLKEKIKIAKKKGCSRKMKEQLRRNSIVKMNVFLIIVSFLFTF